MGALWETYALNQILRAFANRGAGSPPLWFWRTHDGKENVLRSLIVCRTSTRYPMNANIMVDNAIEVGDILFA